MCVLFVFMLIAFFFWSSCVELLYQSCVDLALWYNLNNFCSATLWCAFLIFLVFCSNYISFWFLKVLCMHIYYMYMLWHACLLSLIQYIGEIPSNPKLAKMCMKFNFISMCTYLCGVCPMYCSIANYFGPNKFGDHFALKSCFRYFWRCIGCLPHS